MMNPKAKFFYYMSSPTEGMTESGTFSKDPSQWVVYTRKQVNDMGCKRPDISVSCGDYFAKCVIDDQI